MQKLLFGLPIITSILLWISYHPADQSWAIWVALVPFLAYIKIENNKFRLFVFSWLCGFIFFILGLWWISVVSYPGLFIVSFILAFYFLLFGLFTKAIYIRFGETLFYLCAPLLWVFLEMARAYLLTGFPWLFLAHTQYQWKTFIQISDITGAYGISFLIASINVYITFVLSRAFTKHIPKRKNRLQVVMWGSILVGLMVLSIIYGYCRVKSFKSEIGPKIGIVQSNIEQSLKLKGDRSKEIYLKHFNLSLELLKNNPDLIIWAETMFPYLVKAESGTTDFLGETALACQTDMIIGAVSDDNPSMKLSKLYNSAYLISSEGIIIGRYDKKHLVPVSEFLPMRKVFPFLEKTALKLSELKRLPLLNHGEKPGILKWKNYRIGLLICYESIFPEMSRRLAMDEADFIINLSNDGWFKNSAELEQILIISLFRAVENKITFVRATNTGISAIISPLGLIEPLKNVNGAIKEVEGTLAEKIHISKKKTIYGKYGDYFPFICLLSIAIIILIKIIKLI